MRTYNEELELEARDPEQDYALYKNTCEALATLMSEIQELKASGAKEGVSLYKLKKTKTKPSYLELQPSATQANLPLFVYPEYRG